MGSRVARLYRLVSAAARIELIATIALLVIERLAFAAGAIGFVRQSSLAWVATGAIVALWAIRGLLRQHVVLETRRKLTTTIAETALAHAGDDSFLPGSEADAAVFEGRSAAEQILVRHIPSLLAETTALLVLLFVVRPAGMSVALSLAVLATTGLLLAWQRTSTVSLQKAAWRAQMATATRTLTSIRAASEIVASGNDRIFMNGLRASIDEWAKGSARAERKAALFQRLPFVAVLLLGAAFLAQTGTLRWQEALRFAVLLPPLAGLTRTMFELIRSAPKLATLDPCLADSPREHASDRESAPKGPAEIRFDHVSFAFGNTSVLRDISFVWRPGDAIGIRGANGSGKSTLLKLALGLLQPDAGAVSIGGIDVRRIDLTAWRKTTFYLPQRPYVPDEFSVREVIQLTLPDVTESESRAALALTGAWDHLVRCAQGKLEPFDVPMSRLSVGVRQRVLLARAFARPANLTLLDEPDENLDEHARGALIDLLKRRDPTRTVVIATHDASLLAWVAMIVDLTPRA